MSPYAVATLAALAVTALAALAVLAVIRPLARRLKARYRELLAAVELVQRQATELRQSQEEVRARVEEIGDRLTSRVEPELARLGRHLELEETAAEVERAAAAGRLSPEVSRRLLDHLAELAEASAAGERPY